MLDKPICYSVQLGVLTRENSQDVLKTVLGGGGYFCLCNYFSLVKIGLHTVNLLSKLPGSAPKV